MKKNAAHEMDDGTEGFIVMPSSDYFGMERVGRSKDEFLPEYKAAIDDKAGQYIQSLVGGMINQDKADELLADRDKRDDFLCELVFGNGNNIDEDATSIMIGCVYSAFYVDGAFVVEDEKKRPVSPGIAEKRKRVLFASKFIVDRNEIIPSEKTRGFIVLAIKVADYFLKRDSCYVDTITFLENASESDSFL